MESEGDKAYRLGYQSIEQMRRAENVAKRKDLLESRNLANMTPDVTRSGSRFNPSVKPAVMSQAESLKTEVWSLRKSNGNWAEAASRYGNIKNLNATDTLRSLGFSEEEIPRFIK
jgi:hypothetical protein